MDKSKIFIAEEAARLKLENPSWSYIKAIEKARELIESATEMAKMEEAD